MAKSLREQTQASDGDLRILLGWFQHKTVHTKTHMTFSMLIIMMVTGRDPRAVAAAAPGSLDFSLENVTTSARGEAAPSQPSAVWMEQLLMVRPSRFECQPYWLSLITPHSTFVYGGNESLTNRGVPREGGIAARAVEWFCVTQDVMSLSLCTGLRSGRVLKEADMFHISGKVWF